MNQDKFTSIEFTSIEFTSNEFTSNVIITSLKLSKKELKVEEAETEIRKLIKKYDESVALKQEKPALGIDFLKRLRQIAAEHGDDAYKDIMWLVNQEFHKMNKTEF